MEPLLQPQMRQSDGMSADGPSSLRSLQYVTDRSVAGVSVENLSIRIGDRLLLNHTSAEFPADRLTLILGYSGAGKSMLLKILAGLIPSEHEFIRATGTVRFGTVVSGSDPANAGESPEAAVSSRDGSDSESAPSGTAPSGTAAVALGEAESAAHGSAVSIVFQDFALFDELTPAENIRIALDHGQQRLQPAESERITADLLQQLGVPDDRPVSVLSGGQQQRLAIARAVAPGTRVILYDEPTSGLDAATAVQAARLIRETHDRYRRTSIVVTHDYERLCPIADRILLLDHQQGVLRELSPEDMLDPRAALGDAPEAWAAVQPQRSFATRLCAPLIATGLLAEELIRVPWNILPRWKSARWGLRWLRFYLRLVAGGSAVVYVATACMLLGYVAQDFVFRYLPYRQFSEPLLLENLLHATGFSLYRFLVPILATLLLAARSGAAVTANLGSKVYGGQLDALRSVGADPRRLLRTAVLISFIVGIPVLSVIGYFVAAWSAGYAFLLDHGELGVAFWNAHFHQQLFVDGRFLYRGTGWLLPKLICCGAGTGVIAWLKGTAPKQSAAEISDAVTSAILWSTLYVLLVHFLFSLFEFVPQR